MMCKCVMIDRYAQTEETIFEGTRFQCESVADRFTWDSKQKGLRFEVKD